MGDFGNQYDLQMALNGLDIAPGAVSPDAVTDDSNDREQWSTESITITAGTDFPTLQECVDAIPLIPYHEVTIDVPSGFDASTEDVLVPPIHGGTGHVTGRGFEHKVEIVGDPTTPANNPVGSIVFSGIQGGFITLDGFEIQRQNPHDDEPVGIAAYHSDSVSLDNIAFAGGDSGILSYGRSHVNLYGVNFGASVLTGYAGRVKHGGHIQEQRSGNPPTEGNVGGYAYQPTSGTIITDEASSTLSGTTGYIAENTPQAGFVMDETSSAYTAEFRGGYVMNGEWLIGVAGDGILMRTPDGTATYRVRIDNTGTVVTEQV